MEIKVFFIGVIMGTYAYFAGKLIKGKEYRNQTKCAVWHGLFWACAAGIIFLMLTVNFDNGQTSGIWHFVNRFKLVLWPALTLSAWTIGFFSVRRRDEKRIEKALKNDLEWAETIYPVMIIGGIFMYFLFQGFRIPSGSMKNTLLIGDHLFVNKFIYGTRVPFTENRILKLRAVSRGDVIVFKFPSKSPAESYCGSSQYGRDFIKRVIGLPGETVELRNGRVFINGTELAETYTRFVDTERIPFSSANLPYESFSAVWAGRQLGNIYGEAIRDNFGPVIVPSGTYFAMGDNRDRSCDSRFWGPVPEENIKGKASSIFWPPTRIGSLDVSASKVSKETPD
ncbi:MAG: signal peptidase I [Elusimicrobiaceae bacterium]|nr:signal peptidase I [Elusimicrobiaceae bacterium]